MSYFVSTNFPIVVQLGYPSCLAYTPQGSTGRSVRKGLLFHPRLSVKRKEAFHRGATQHLKLNSCTFT